MMKKLLFLLVIVTNTCFVFSQKESANWCVHINSQINFNTLPPTISYGLPFTTLESSASVSDENGNLLFYTDGDTVRGSDGNVLPNGENVSFSPANVIQSSTQGALFLKKPNSNNLFYLFSLGHTSFGSRNVYFSYSVIDQNMNGGLGAVISQHNQLCLDTLAEKLIATKHCNGRDYWIVVVKLIATKLFDGMPIEYETEFRSYLLTENGIQISPVKSRLKTKCTRFGQMKFNNAGNEIAFGQNNFLTLLDFDKSTGNISMKMEYPVYLGAAYGLEYSPNDAFVYINEQQFEIATGILTPLYQNYPSQLQRGLDGKIYSIRLTKDEGLIDYSFSSTIWTWDLLNIASLFGTKDSTLNVAVVDNPDIAGTGCQYNPNYVSFTQPTYYNKVSMSLPNFPSYLFNQKISDFNYTGTCEGESFQFSLSNTAVVPDSVHWIFYDNNEEITAFNPTHLYSESGEYQVSCIAYINGISYYSTQCVVVCGANELNLPTAIDLCKTPVPFELNALNTCSTQYAWNTGDTTAAITIQNEGLYTLQTTNECGVNEYTIEVFKGDDCNVLTEIPNVLTANEDQTNDWFSINVKNAISFEYKIVNRWGNLIFEGNKQIPASSVFSWNSYNLWDGKDLNGTSVSEGVYYYIIDFVLFNGDSTVKNGFITLIQ